MRREEPQGALADARAGDRACGARQTPRCRALDPALDPDTCAAELSLAGVLEFLIQLSSRPGLQLDLASLPPDKQRIAGDLAQLGLLMPVAHAGKHDRRYRRGGGGRGGGLGPGPSTATLAGGPPGAHASHAEIGDLHLPSPSRYHLSLSPERSAGRRTVLVPTHLASLVGKGNQQATAAQGYVIVETNFRWV